MIINVLRESRDGGKIFHIFFGSFLDFVLVSYIDIDIGAPHTVPKNER